MKQMQTQELISALADGQLEGQAFARGVQLAAADAGARETWATYHLIGDVLRLGDRAVGSDPAAFLARLQPRLERERLPVPAVGVVEAAPVAGRAEAANDGSFRWKVVAGLASVTAVAAVAWSLAGPAVNRTDAGQLATAGNAGTVLAVGERGGGVMIRDPQLDELLAAHRRLGASALQMSPAFVRNAAFESTGR